MDQSGTNSTSSQYNLDATTPKSDSDFPLRKTGEFIKKIKTIYTTIMFTKFYFR